MKRIEDIKEFKDIDTYYEISKIVDEVFQDRVEAHKHLVTANKEIERLNKKIEQYENPEDMTLMFMWCDEKAKDEIKRLNNIINELKEWFKGYHKSYASCKWCEEDYIEFIEHLEEELKGSDK